MMNKTLLNEFRIHFTNSLFEIEKRIRDSDSISLTFTFSGAIPSALTFYPSFADLPLAKNR